MNYTFCVPEFQMPGKIVEITINTAFVEGLINGTKKTIMCQANIVPGSKIKISSISPRSNKIVTIGYADAPIIVGLKIIPRHERILLKQGILWQELKKEIVKKVIANEGFTHSDDFWKLQEKETFECVQIYFENLIISSSL